MAVQFSQDSAFAKEMVKWEAQHTPLGAPGRPYVFYEYPKMVYRATRPTSGPPEIAEAQIVDGPLSEYLRARGFRDSALEAIALVEQTELEHAKLAAEINFDVRRMSPEAKREAEAAMADASGHLPSVPETPLPPKNKGAPR